MKVPKHGVVAGAVVLQLGIPAVTHETHAPPPSLLNTADTAAAYIAMHTAARFCGGLHGPFQQRFIQRYSYHHNMYVLEQILAIHNSRHEYNDRYSCEINTTTITIFASI